MTSDVNPKTPPEIRKTRFKIDWKSIGYAAVMPVLAVLLALFVGAIMLLLLGVNPLEAYSAMISGVFGSVSGMTQALVKATPLLLVGLGICIAFPRQRD